MMIYWFILGLVVILWLSAEFRCYIAHKEIDAAEADARYHRRQHSRILKKGKP